MFGDLKQLSNHKQNLSRLQRLLGQQTVELDVII